ncbi:hypothetical protein KJ632_02080 [Patescibacteria group bacterium]|nr:hypothetical protein [Patescibacteria group bacterium]
MKKVIICLVVLMGGCFGVAKACLPVGMAEIFDDWAEIAEIVEDESLEEGEFMGKVYLEGEFLDGDILRVEVNGDVMKFPVLGASFHLGYEGEKLAFLKYEPGGFLEIGGDPFYLVTDEADKAEIVYGETLRKDDNFPVGGGVFAKLYFQILEDEEFAFEFKNGVVSSIDTVRQDIDKIDWQAGILSKDNQKKVAGELKASVLDRQNEGFLSYFSVLGGLFILVLSGVGFWFYRRYNSANSC